MTDKTLQDRLREARDELRNVDEWQLADDVIAAADALDAQADKINRLSARCESQRLKIAELESKLARNFEDYANTLKAQNERIKALEGALREMLSGIESGDVDMTKFRSACDVLGGTK